MQKLLHIKRDDLLDDTKTAQSTPKIAKVTSVSSSGTIKIDYKGNQFGALDVRILSNAFMNFRGIASDLVGSSVVVIFEDDDPRLPVVIGLVDSKLDRKMPMQEVINPVRDSVDLTADSETLLIEANKEVILRCGQSTIHLTKSGKVIIRGTQIVSRSSGVNKIRGGSVVIN